MYIENKEIKCTMSYVKTFSIILFLLMVLGGFSSIYFASNIQSPLLAILGFIIFIILPIILNKQLRKFFLKSFKIIFEEKFILIEITNLKDEKVERRYQFNYEDIKSCIITSTSSKTSTIKLGLVHSKNIQFTFVNELISKDSKNYDNNISLNILTNLYLYNKEIKFLPTFYASKNGIIALTILSVVLLSAIITNILYSSSALPFTLFMSAALYFQIIIRRKRDLEIYKNLQQMFKS